MPARLQLLRRALGFFMYSTWDITTRVTRSNTRPCLTTPESITDGADTRNAAQAEAQGCQRTL